MARDRKRAKQRQRRDAQRQSSRARSGRPSSADTSPAEADDAESLPTTQKIDPDQTIPDLEHGSSGADIAKASIAAGAINPAEVSESLDAEIGHHPEKGEIFPDEILDDGYLDAEAEADAEGQPLAEGEPLEDEGTEDSDAESVDVAAGAAAGRPRKRSPEPTRKSGNRVVTFLSNSWEELKRVQWPDRRQVAQATGVVIAFVVIVGLYLGAADYVFSKLVDAII